MHAFKNMSTLPFSLFALGELDRGACSSAGTTAEAKARCPSSEKPNRIPCPPQSIIMARHSFVCVCGVAPQPTDDLIGYSKYIYTCPRCIYFIVQYHPPTHLQGRQEMVASANSV